MEVFWKNGFFSTSMQQLEKEMEINKFSIYTTFESKSGLLQACLKCYAEKLSVLLDELKSSPNGINAIKQYFYDFITFSADNTTQKGCLITNTVREFSNYPDNEISAFTNKCMTQVKDVFAQKLRESQRFSNKEIEQKADYLFTSMFGFSTASKVFSKSQLSNYIEHTFCNI